MVQTPLSDRWEHLLKARTVIGAFLSGSQREQEQMGRVSNVLVVLAVFGGQARADDACVAELNKLARDWSSIAIPGTTAVEPNSSSTLEYNHDAREVQYMRCQFRLALRLCSEDKKHEAMCE